MWPVEKKRLSSGAVKYVFTSTAYCEVLDGWADDSAFREFFSELITSSEFSSLAWETPPLHESNLDQRFEFVLSESPRLATARPNRGPFSSHFKNSSDSVLIFPNLGGDALMVVPRPISDDSVYGHLAAFLRKGPESQKHAFWQALAKATRRRLKAKPLWVSTAGLGVSWLHGRVCSTPKYYRHREYTIT